MLMSTIESTEPVIVVNVVVEPPVDYNVQVIDFGQPIYVNSPAGGPPGPEGPQGIAGPGVPTGGAVGEVLTKTGIADFATSWQVTVDPTKLPLAGGTLTGKLNTKASAPGGAGINLGVGSNPTAGVAGDIWMGLASFSWWDGFNGSVVSAVSREQIQSITGAKTFTDRTIFATPTTAIPSIRLPHGVAPSAPTNGDVWTTSAGLFIRINGITIGPLISAASVPDEVVNGTITISAVAPSSPSVGDVWIDTN